ncbi:MAG: hypothetical protein QM785_14460 [Pyrinomonadaceae bacterium]
MQSEIRRRFGASLLVMSVWCGGIAVIPAVAQEDKKPATAKESDKKDSGKKDAKPKATPTPSAPAPLSTKEDPAQIGKRNINKGTDKFFGWLGGSQEKEMQIGRQLAMEVEQQSKLVDDPVITEYVNRVGQNVVLHSDAKIPFTIKVIDSDEVNAFRAARRIFLRE